MTMFGKTMVLGFATVGLSAGMALAGPTLDRVMGAKELVVATNAGWPPQSYLDDNKGSFAGECEILR